MDEHTIAAIILGVLVVGLIVYFIILFETYREGKFIFTPYQPPTPPSPSFYPLGSVTPMDPTALERRNEIIQAALNA